MTSVDRRRGAVDRDAAAALVVGADHVAEGETAEGGTGAGVGNEEGAEIGLTASQVR